ncbi:MAG: hypothetical protein U1U88_001927 [Lawsonella clevelandensis]
MSAGIASTIGRVVGADTAAGDGAATSRRGVGNSSTSGRGGGATGGEAVVVAPLCIPVGPE